MGGKQQGSSAPTIRPRGPQVAGPTNASTGPPILGRILGPALARVAVNQDRFRDTAANIVGTVASIVSNAFVPGTGAFASVAANRTVREQVNLVNGRPVLESTEEPLKDWPSILGSLVGGYGLGAVGGAAGGAVGGAAGQAAGQSAGSFIGSQAGGYAGGVARNALYGGGRPTSPYYVNPYRRSLIYGGY